jgi:large subunit ribosomal protein L10
VSLFAAPLSQTARVIEALRAKVEAEGPAIQAEATPAAEAEAEAPEAEAAEAPAVEATAEETAATPESE